MNKRKITSVLVSIALLAGAAGCSQKAEETTAVTTTSAATTTTEATTEISESVTETEAEEGSQDYLEGYETFEVTSEDLVDGVWADVISKDQGDNVSPQLSWEEVEGAEVYIIYMVDPDAGFWIHWKSDGITETELPQGWADSAEYVGPYPPSGTTHHYDIYVVALRAPVDHLSGSVNSGNPNFVAFLTGVDTDAEGNSGNIISYGRISGTFTSP